MRIDDVENIDKSGVREFKSVPKELLEKHYVVCFILDIHAGNYLLFFFMFFKGIIDAENFKYFSEEATNKLKH